MTKIRGALPEPLLVVTSYHNQINTKPKRKHIRASWWWVCIYSSPNRIIPSSRRTEGGSFPADDPRPRVAVPDPVVCFRLRLHVVQRPPVHLLLFILSALMRRESLLDHWESLRIGWCVAQVSYITPLPHTMDECTIFRGETWQENIWRQSTKTRRLHTNPIRYETGYRHS